MTVYIEYVLIDNFLIDYMLISLTLRVVGISINKVKVALTSALGAIFALIFPLLNLSEFILGALKLISGFLLITISTPRINGKKLYLCYVFFLTFTFLLGGTLIGVYEIFNLDYSSEISVALAFLPCYLIIRFITEIINYLYQKQSIESFCYDTELIYNEKPIKLKGFLDSGNSAFYNGLPIIFLDEKKAKLNFILTATINYSVP